MQDLSNSKVNPPLKANAERVSMKYFTRGIYTPIGELKEIDLNNYTREFVFVSFEQDGFSNSKLMAVYGWGFDCWYILR